VVEEEAKLASDWKVGKAGGKDGHDVTSHGVAGHAVVAGGGGRGRSRLVQGGQQTHL